MKRRRKSAAPKRSRKHLNENLAVLAALQQQIDQQCRLILDLRRGRPISALDDEENCPPLPDPNADPNVYLCQIEARVKYLLGSITCAEYQAAYAACSASS